MIFENPKSLIYPRYHADSGTDSTVQRLVHESSRDTEMVWGRCRGWWERKKIQEGTQARSAEVQDGRHVAQRPAFQLKFIWIAGKGANMVSCSQLRHM